MTRRSLLIAALLAAAALTACAETVVEIDEGATASVNGDEVTTTPPTTLPITGSAAELLPEMATEMSQLSGQIAEDGDERATLARIDAIWVTTRAEVEATSPELVSGIDATVEMATIAVTRVRPADADKAFSILTDLVDRYTGDG